MADMSLCLECCHSSSRGIASNCCSIIMSDAGDGRSQSRGALLNDVTHYSTKSLWLFSLLLVTFPVLLLAPSCNEDGCSIYKFCIYIYLYERLATFRNFFGFVLPSRPPISSSSSASLPPPTIWIRQLIITGTVSLSQFLESSKYYQRKL